MNCLLYFDEGRVVSEGSDKSTTMRSFMVKIQKFSAWYMCSMRRFLLDMPAIGVV